MSTSIPPAPHPPRPARSVEPVPPEPVAAEDLQAPLGVPKASRYGNQLVLENEPILPTDICIKSGRPASRTMIVNLRDPRNPKTWFGKRPQIEVGICRKHHENHSVSVSLTWSVAAIGFLLLVVGGTTMSLFSLILGIVSLAFSGIFRAASPVTSRDATDSFATVDGVSSKVLEQFPDYEIPSDS
ncbi:MAG: hypothetical protein AAGC68_03010 [Verrucomicrobiota bacterium]